MSICYVMLVLLCGFSTSFPGSSLYLEFGGFFRGFQRFEVFFEQVFHSDCIRQKRECSPNADGVRFFDRAKTNYIIAKHVYTRRFVRDRSFLEVLILDRARPVWSACEITCFCYIAGTDDRILFCSRTRLCIALAL